MFLLRYVCLLISREGLLQDISDAAQAKRPLGQAEVDKRLEEWGWDMAKAGITVRECTNGMDPTAAQDAAGPNCLQAQAKDAPTLWITDDPRHARELKQKGYAVLGLMSPSSEKTFESIQYLGYHLTEMEPEFLERVYRRQRGIPWEILETKRCIVRETCQEDAKALYEIYAEPSITRFMEDLPKESAEFDAWLDSYAEHVYAYLEYGLWTVCMKNGMSETGNEIVIGRAGLTVREGYEDPELGFVIGKPWQHQGYALEVLSAILGYAGEIGISKVIAFVHHENEASLALLQRLGFYGVRDVVVDGRECILLERFCESEGEQTWQEQ